MASEKSASGCSQETLSVVFLIGSDSESTRNSIRAVCEIPQAKLAAVLVDTEPVSLSRRYKNLKRNVRVDGWRYLLRRPLRLLSEFTEGLASRAAVSPMEVAGLLRRAFPDRCFNLEQLGERYAFPVHFPGNLNGKTAAGLLSACEADLGIVLGTRILKASTFDIPRLGCINLHKGKVPEYRGMPPGFWELANGATSAGVTVHFVDKGLDTGDVLVTRETPILSTDTPETLMEKLHREGAEALAEAVRKIQDGSAVRRPQPRTANKPRSRPSHKDVLALQRRLPHWRTVGDGYRTIKNLYSLAVYYLGGYALARAFHRGSTSRAAILLYHRVNDYARDPLTANTRIFASHLLALSKRYSRMATSELVRRVRAGLPIPPTSIAIHFDDCYREVFTNGAPILAAAGFPAAAFLNSGFVDTERIYPHDATKYPFHLPNLSSAEVRAWADSGFEVGNHTANHVDLGVHPLEEVKREIRDCEQRLKSITGEPVRLFSFPFGGFRNIRPEVVECIREYGYLALFSAHGGFVTAKTDAYDIPRLGASGDLNPLLLLLELEGLAPYQVAGRFRHTLNRIKTIIGLRS
jgi:peptidoglycan/xylan/chitin deacetylase (PgdA/CDA1 family)